ncbi:MAG TPA: site-2 protease family protein [Geminicoccaceae bacterium]|nr:site-2 protease family protein [Geminicoccus sp.]HMU52431.1 site-2 protease family protein [Geminicoccaceae bacterium]
MPDLLAIGQQLSIWFLPVVTAITVHEAAHAFAADRLGDDTARRLGRLSFNPVRHVDPFGTLVLPGILLLLQAPFLFGWAKPVPVAFHRLHHPKRDMVWVALAGPAVNVAMALAAALLLHLVWQSPDRLGDWISANLQAAIGFNIILAVFNMMPIPPLDGGRVLTGILPLPLAIRYARIERYGLLILLGLLFIVPMLGRELGFDVNPVATILGPFLDALQRIVLVATGWPLPPS